MLPIIQRAALFADKIAIEDSQGSFTYQELWQKSSLLAGHLLAHQPDLQEKRVAFIATQTADYVVMLWAIWQAGGIAVPLAVSHPTPEIVYILHNTQAEVVLTNSTYEAFLSPICQAQNRTLLNINRLNNSLIINDLPEINRNRRALIIYTSGTTGKPKGAVTTHQMIEAQIRTLVEAWEWQSSDYILEVLPLHHIHGIINVMACALWTGARVRMLEKFVASTVWDLFLYENFTVFMAVPTIYNRLIGAWEDFLPQKQSQILSQLQKFRLMVSGSAALPVSVLHKWQQISGHTLLERYGMTEIGMALSNPLYGVRRAGKVGLPLPQVEVRLIDENNQVMSGYDVAGEIQVKSPAVFLEYWQNPEATAQSFVEGWFKTGDVAQRDAEGYYQILGRNSTDIIKTGGYKVSALEIEETLRNHPQIAECAVVGLPDEDWGEKIALAIIQKDDNKALTINDLRDWAKKYLAPYKIPNLLLICTDLPRNAMGKIIKSELKKLFETN
ncbi:MAG: acyl-CoA synthetase [Microscillaceae bacterium]|jgi:malonyl-CoA/methylmalonyl-CoA synthetase|nr:acyl-CoA synthetase [Microscillaceae bacterium]